MTAKQYLRQGYRLKELIQTHRDELAELRSLLGYAPGIGYDKIGSSPAKWNGETAETNLVIKCIDMEDQIQREIDQMFSVMKSIHATIEEVKDPDERLVLRCKYILFLSWGEISAVMNFSSAQARRVHDEALRRVKVPEEYLLKS